MKIKNPILSRFYPDPSIYNINVAKGKSKDKSLTTLIFVIKRGFFIESSFY